MPDSSNQRPSYTSDTPLPRWVTGELPAPDVYHHVLEAATGYQLLSCLHVFLFTVIYKLAVLR